MVANSHLKVLGKIVSRLKDSSINWVVTGSLGMALQGVPVEVHDIDLQRIKTAHMRLRVALLNMWSNLCAILSLSGCALISVCWK